MERARALEKLAEMYWRQGKHGEAQPLLERALAIHEELSGPESVETAVALAKLACLYSEQGKDGESQLLCGHSLAISDAIIGQLSRTTGPESTGRKVSEHEAGQLEQRKLRKGLRLLALLYSEQSMRYMEHSKCDAAHPLLQRSLVMFESLNGSDSTEVTTTLTKLAWLHRRQGKYAEAEEACRRALHSSETALGANSSETASCLNNLAVILREQGNYADAAVLCVRSLDIHEETLGHSRETAMVLNNQAWIYCQDGDFERAQAACERSLKITEKVLGPGHTQTILVMNSLASILYRQRKYKEAVNVFTRCAAVLRSLQKQHLPVSTTVTILGGWAASCLGLGNVEEAQKLYSQALTMATACEAQGTVENMDSSLAACQINFLRDCSSHLAQRLPMPQI